MLVDLIGPNRGPVVATWLGSGIAAWVSRVSETTTATTGLLLKKRTGRRLGRMNQKWLEEYIADSSKHDPSC